MEVIVKIMTIGNFHINGEFMKNTVKPVWKMEHVLRKLHDLHGKLWKF